MLLSYCERLTDFFISQCGLPETRRSWYIYALQTRISMFLSTAGMMLLGCLVATPYPSDLFSCRNFIFAQTSRWLSREDAAAMLILVDWCIHSLFEHCKQPCSV